MKSKVVLLVAVFTSILGTSACSTKQAETPISPPEQTASAPQQGADAEFIEMEGYRFKLDPDVQADGVAHLDFYVRDLDGKHVKGVTGNFKITKPDGTKVELPIEEESPHDHYHGMLKLDQPGEYLIVAQASIGDKKLNPRFSFSRKQ
jgi:hypothetical protein